MRVEIFTNGFPVYTGGNVEGTPIAAPVTAFKCFLVEDAIIGQFVGGSYDNISAVTVATDAYRTLQDYNPRSNVGVIVVDDTGINIAYIGRWFTEEWGPEPVPAAPVLMPER